MKIDSAKLLLELQAIQGMNGPTQPTENVFQEMLNDYLLPSLNADSQTLGSVYTAISSLSGSFGSTNTLPLNMPITTNSVPATVTASTHSKTDYESMISEAASLYNLPEKLIQSVIKQESNFKADAQSSAGASGLMQLMPATAQSLGVTDILDPKQNIMAGSKYLSQMLTKYDGDTELALAAYNAGPGNVDKYGGIPPFAETRNYVNKVINSYLT
jgi:soluble lytic murein transglycosylase-like protein